MANPAVARRRDATLLPLRADDHLFAFAYDAGRNGVAVAPGAEFQVDGEADAGERPASYAKANR